MAVTVQQADQAGAGSVVITPLCSARSSASTDSPGGGVITTTG